MKSSPQRILLSLRMTLIFSLLYSRASQMDPQPPLHCRRNSLFRPLESLQRCPYRRREEKFDGGIDTGNRAGFEVED